MTHPQSLMLTTGLLAVLLSAGCQTYTAQTETQNAALRSGNTASAATEANRAAKRHHNSKDAVLYRLEQGNILRSTALSNPASLAYLPQDETLGNAADASPSKAYFKSSNKVFDLAEARINQFEERAKVRIGATIGATLSNQANIPYSGRAYDKVMMNTYKALNDLQLGDFDSARVELNRALQRQRDAVDANARRIEKAQSEADAARKGTLTQDGQKTGAYDVDKAKADPKTGPALAAVETELNSKILPYGDYVNPFSVWLDGFYFLNRGADSADLERARKSLERVHAFSAGNPYVKVDLDAASSGAAPSGITYVIFETGAAPYRDQLRIDIPTFLVTGSVSYVGAAFPKLKYNGNYVQTLRVSDGTSSYNSALLCSMDSVVSQDFKNEWPSIVTRTLISTATKAVLDAVVQNQAKKQFGFTGQLLAKVATAGAQAAINIADTRTWRSLPKEFQLVRLPTPASRQITLSAGATSQSVTVEPGSVSVVYVKSTSANAPLLVSQFTLK